MSALPLDLVPAPDEPLARPRPSTVAWRGPRNPWDDPTFRPEERGESRAAQRAKVEAIQARAIAQDAGRDEGGEEGIGARLAEASQVPADTLGPSARDRLRARVGGNLRAGAGRRLFDVRGEASPPDLRPCGCERRLAHRPMCRFSSAANTAPSTAPPATLEPEPTKETPVTTTPPSAETPPAPAPEAPTTPPDKRPCGCPRMGSHAPKVCMLMTPEQREKRLAQMRAGIAASVASRKAAAAAAAAAAANGPRPRKRPPATEQVAPPSPPAVATLAPLPVAPQPARPASSPAITASVHGVTFAFADPLAAVAFARALAQEGHAHV